MWEGVGFVVLIKGCFFGIIVLVCFLFVFGKRRVVFFFCRVGGGYMGEVGRIILMYLFRVGVVLGKGIRG